MVKFSVNVNTMSETTLKNRHVPRTFFGLQYYRTTDERAAPTVYPKYTTLPSNPNLAFSIPSSAFITVDPAGRIPISIFIKRLMKNWIKTNANTYFGSISEGR